MIRVGERKCPKCGGDLMYYDMIRRLLRGKYGISRHILVNRFRCNKCHSLHRELPREVFPYKHYEIDIIAGVLNGTITSEVIGFEDRPCTMTMYRWMNTHVLQSLLWQKH